jgi:tRNA (guanosine-2'-O-)-methyltransferase
VRAEVLAAMVALAAPALSCIDVAAPPRELDVSIPEGAGLESTCTPTGPEICFNARDDNCNGVIDEGCGLHTGILQFVIAWELADVDVDLNVFDPTGAVAKVGDASAAGLIKDRDCPRSSECQGQNVENVYLSEGEPKKGHYKVVVHLEKLNGATAPVRVRLGVRMGPKSFGRTFELSPGPGTEDMEFAFDLR